MTTQTFRVVIRVDAEVESAGKLYLTEHRVKTQLQKFLKHHQITDGLPCHGTATMQVVDVIGEEVKT